MYVLQVVVVDHDTDPDLARVDSEAAEAIGASCKEGPLACIQASCPTCPITSAAQIMPLMSYILTSCAYMYVPSK